MNIQDISIQIGEYIFYPAAILLLLIIVIVATIIFVRLMKAKSASKIKKAYKITDWQKAELPATLDYVRDEIEDEAAKQYYHDNQDVADQFNNYLAYNKVWDYNSIKSISDDAPFVLSKMLFYDVESSLTEYDDGEERALLLLNSIDLINGGPVYNGNECIWMMDDIEEFPDANVPALQNRVKTVFQQALINISDQIDEEDGIIPDTYDLPYYVKGYTRDEIVEAAGNLAESPGFGNILPETKAAIIHGLLFSLNNYFQFDNEDVDELHICYIRCLMCLLSGKMYDELAFALRDYRL